MNNSTIESNTFGERLICKRPPTIAMCVQVIHPNNQSKRLSVEFGGWDDNQPNWTDKKSLRLNIGETSLLLACILGYMPECRAGYRESGLFLNVDRKSKPLKLSMYEGSTQVGYINPTASEQFQIYQLGLQVMKRDGMSSKDVLDEFKFYFGVLGTSPPNVTLFAISHIAQCLSGHLNIYFL